MHHVEVDVARSGQIIGRFTLLQLRKSVEARAVGPDDLYYDAKTQNWIELGEHPFLKDDFRRINQEADSRRRKIYLTYGAGIPAIILIALAAIHGLQTSKEYQGEQPPVTSPKKIPAGTEGENAKIEQIAHTAAPQSTSKSQEQVFHLASESERPIEAEAFGRYGNEIFPSFILTMANLTRKNKGGTEHKYGDEAQAAVVVRNVKKGDRYQVEISADRFINRVSKQYDFSQGSAAVMLAPVATFDYLELTKVKQTMPFNVTFKITRHDGKVFETTQVWQVRQINDCPLKLDQRALDKEGKVIETQVNWPEYTFAGYVNENHPWIDSILAEALRTGLVDSFEGPGDLSNKAKIANELSAIWQALKVRGVTYSNITSTTGTSKSQHVRFFEECIGTAQANCIDGTAMLASIYRKIGYSVGIALVPGHAYLVIYGANGPAFGVETTQIGTSSFESAIQYATEGAGAFSLQKILQMNKEQIEKHKVILISIDECRKEGVEPIPFLGKDGVLTTSAPTTFGSPRALVNEDVVTTDAEVYLNSNGMLSSRQFGSRIELLSRQILEKQSNVDRAAQLKRKAAAYRLIEEMESAVVAFAGVGSPGDRVSTALVECLREAEAHRRGFIALNPKPTLFLTGNRVADAELAQTYEDSVKTLGSINLRPEAQQDTKSLNEAMTLCKALKDLSELPLKFN